MSFMIAGGVSSIPAAIAVWASSEAKSVHRLPVLWNSRGHPVRILWQFLN